MEEFVECIKESNIKVRPLLKWAGGKSKLLPLILPFLGQGDYLEPFLGSGAVAFAVQSNKMILNDKNIKLMNFYEQVKNRPEKLHRKIVKYASSFNCAPDKEVFFYETRAYYNDLTMVEYNNGLTHASLFWVINKTCFNGMYRETKGGDFNIPYGKRVQARSDGLIAYVAQAA